MKKLLTILASLTMFTTLVSADFLRIEGGAGAWMQTPNTDMEYKDSTGLSGTDTSLSENETQGYVWMLVKQPIPLIPNLRLEYVNISSVGKGEGQFAFFDVNLAGDTPSSIEMTQFDIIPYYNILDNLAWTTVDIGLDIKVMEMTYTATPSTGFGLLGDYVEVSNEVIPLLYVRARVEIPATNIGLETDVKYITDGTSTISDVRVKVDYTLDFVPVIQPGVELGYRMQKMYMETDEDLIADFDFSGVYLGVMVRF